MGAESIELEDFQDRFVQSSLKIPILEAGWGTGKTLCLITKAVILCQTIPDNLGIIFRKEWEDLRDSTCRDFETYTGIKVPTNRDVEIPCFNPDGSRAKSSTLMFRHMEELHNLQNMNLGFAGIEQAEELEGDDQFWKLWGRLRRVNTSRQLFMIANADGQNWVRRLGVNGLKDKDGNQLVDYIEATTWGNAKNLPQDFLDGLLVLKNEKPGVYQRFVMNDHEVGDASDNLVNPSDFAYALKNSIAVKPRAIKRVTIVDPARYGDDEIVIMNLENTKIAKTLVIDKTTPEITMFTARAVVREAIAFQSSLIVIDVIGIGGGVADRIHEEIREINDRAKRGEGKPCDISVSELNSAGKPMNDGKYTNVRDEMWDNASVMFVRKQIDLSECVDDKMRQELTSVKYKFQGKKLKVEPKEDVKKRIGRSPGRADCYVMGLYKLGECQSQSDTEEYEDLDAEQIDSWERDAKQTLSGVI